MKETVTESKPERAVNRETATLNVDSVFDLSNRWQAARLSGLKKFLPIPINSEDVYLQNISSLDEHQFDELLKLIFLNSRNLGLGYQKTFGLAWDLNDIVDFLPQLKSPCIHGKWDSSSSAKQLTRGGCTGGASGGLRYCQFWREAIDGIVTGLCDSERFVRHECMQAGNSQCVDVFYEEKSTLGDIMWQDRNRWGHIPEIKIDPLKLIESKFQAMEIDLKFLGATEGRLFYKMTSKKALSCGASGNMMRSYLQKHVNDIWSEIKLQDASPVAVYGEKT